MAAKYQVFISSTYEDLKEERDIAIKAVLEMGHIPVGMEMFSAADDQQWQIIARHIDESDYYCVILAHRYGSMVDGLSFTQKEYEYALDRGVPVMGFVLDESASWPADMIDGDINQVEGLANFRDLVKLKPVSFWKSADDLYGKVSIALSKAFTANPREGWVRASEVAGPEVTRELTRLSAENSGLRNEIKRLSSERESEKAAEFARLLKKMGRIERSLDYKYSRQDKEWTRSIPIALLEFFYWIAPSLATEQEVTDTADELAMNLREDKDRTWWVVALNQVRDLLSNFMALGLVAPSTKKHAVADKGEYWTLTSLGRDVHAHMRLELLGQQEVAAEESDGLNEEPSHDVNTKNAEFNDADG